MNLEAARGGVQELEVEAGGADKDGAGEVAHEGEVIVLFFQLGLLSLWYHPLLFLILQPFVWLVQKQVGVPVVRGPAITHEERIAQCQPCGSVARR